MRQLRSITAHASSEMHQEIVENGAYCTPGDISQEADLNRNESKPHVENKPENNHNMFSKVYRAHNTCDSLDVQSEAETVIDDIDDTEDGIVAVFQAKSPVQILQRPAGQQVKSPLVSSNTSIQPRVCSRVLLD